MPLEIRLCTRLDEVDATDWDALHDGANPFVRHAFLAGLEQHGCLRADWGWTPAHVTLWENGALVAAAPGYLKTNSHGEFVFDHAWAQAYENAGRPYYPKWLGAVPYSPVTGPRLLAVTPEFRTQLRAAIEQLVLANDLSSAHINFPQTPVEPDGPRHWLERNDIQFQWTNPGHWHTFEDFLAAMDHKRRKNIRQERSRVNRAGIRMRVVEGAAATEADLDAMFGFYLQTFVDYGNHPALNRSFFQHLATAMPEALVLFLAEDDEGPVAGALCLRGADTLYGRYWGARRQVPGLHFETCYYRGIEYCLQQGLRRFEPGAQGEHKLARGFLPQLVRSHHFLADSDARSALAQWCQEERRAVRQRAQRLALHTPFRIPERGDYQS